MKQDAMRQDSTPAGVEISHKARLMFSRPILAMGGETGAMSDNPCTGSQNSRAKTHREKVRSSRKTSADRQRRYRARRNAGVEVVAVQVDGVALTERLIEAGLLAEQDAEDRGKISAALSGVVRFWLGSDA
ncbi:hypothetical protein [Xanthobacter sp. KR7-225]|uniref:hypothetical protein n=1 Tax=Xanthobacter sp. KR7-225 TaxID=3156613 RepID=UPI0032B314AF